MASDSDWIAETVGDFIHSRIWLAPIYTFIEHNCLSFDYEDENDDDNDQPRKSHQETLKDEHSKALREEQLKIYEKYQQLVDSLIGGLGHDLNLDKELLNKACALPSGGNSTAPIDESYEQLYAARNFSIFQEMMRRRNLILQLQALVTLQLQWGLLKPSETGEDLVLSLLLQATSPSAKSANEHDETPTKADTTSTRNQTGNHQRETQKKSIEPVDYDDDDDVQVVEARPQIKPKTKVEPKKAPAQEVRKLADLRRRPDIDAEWHRKLRNDFDEEENAKESSKIETGQTLSEVPQDVLREKLRELSIRTSQVNPEAAAALNSRSEFLRQQRDLLLKKQGTERKQDIEQQTKNARPQSAAYAANRAMTNLTKQSPTAAEKEPQVSAEELERRQALMRKLKHQVVDKH